MSDWADNVASEAVRNCSVSPPLGNINRDDLMPQFAAALRRAKADGIRFAADQWENPIYSEFKKSLYKMADDIEAADPPCADCGGTGVTFQTERRCACQPSPPPARAQVRG